MKKHANLRWHSQGYVCGRYLKALGVSQESLLLIVNQYAKSTLRWQLSVEGKNGLPPIKRKTAGKMPLPKSLLQGLNLSYQVSLSSPDWYSMIKLLVSFINEARGFLMIRTFPPSRRY